jgi:adenosylhomocysteine nucleosidase
MRILFVAAEAMEFEGVLARASGVAPVSMGADWARSCRIGDHEALLVANGAGRKRASEAAEAGIEPWRPAAVVSTGFCGALDEGLGVADVVVGAGLTEPRPSGSGIGSLGCSVPLPNGRGSITGLICSSDEVARTAEDKRRLRATGAVAVEMEAAGVAERAREHGLPFYCIRAVTDLAGETLANDFGAALRSDGHFDTIAILAGALRHPSNRVPELFRLRSRCKRAARALGDFFAVCGF